MTLFQERLRIEAVHAGLEYGHFARWHPDLNMVPAGVELFDVHSVGEYVS